MSRRVGILGIGTYLPPDVRHNDWWPTDTVRRWHERANRPRAAATAASHPTEGSRLAAAAIAALADDPFRGAVERRVMSKAMSSLSMELEAARAALARAAVPRSEIDLLLVYSSLPVHYEPSNAGALHRELGLPRGCTSLSTQAACNSFLAQLAIAEGMIAGGVARHALLVQSACYSRLVPYDAPHSAWFGDGATAVVVGPVGERRGVIGRSHNTDGRNGEALVFGTPGAPSWSETGPMVLHSPVAAAASSMVLATVERGRQAVTDALAQAKVAPDEVGFYACHQGFRWLRHVTQDYIGMSEAHAIDTFAYLGHLGACNLPMILAQGEREHLIEDGDTVALFSGGIGEVWSSVVLDWGTD